MCCRSPKTGLNENLNLNILVDFNNLRLASHFVSSRLLLLFMSKTEMHENERTEG